MNSAQRKAVEDAIGNAEDAFYRYHKQRQSAGNDTFLVEKLEKLKKTLAALREGL